MKANIYYKEFLTEDQKQIIEKIEYDLSDTILLTMFNKINDNGKKYCEIKIEDKIGVAELETQIKKQDIREIIELMKKMYQQL